MNNKYIAVIPARGGSKGIKGKNLRKIGGISLLAHTILQAKQTKIFEDIIVSTDDDCISQEANYYNITLHNRAAKNATDYAKTIDVISEIIDYYDFNDQICVLLQVTSPLRKPIDIIECIRMYEQVNDGSIVSITEVEHHPYKMLLKKKQEFQPITSIECFELPRQNLEKVYRINGAIYIAKFSDLKKNKSFFFKPQQYFEMTQESSIDIDKEIDLAIASILLEKNKNEAEF